MSAATRAFDDDGAAAAIQIKHYGVTFRRAEIPVFDDGTPAVIEAPSEYVDQWCWTDGWTPRRVHPQPVPRSRIVQMIRANRAEWGASPESINAEIEAVMQGTHGSR